MTDDKRSGDGLVTIDSLRPADWPAVRRIYIEGIETGNATFETVAPEWEAWDASHRTECRLAARAGDELAGWAALSSVSRRAVYSGLAEVSVYVAARRRGKGAGRRLLERLIECSESIGIWTLQAGILSGNAASLTLHERCGFRRVGVREKMGRLSGVYRDVVLMERRSRRIEFDGTADADRDAANAAASPPDLSSPLCARLLRFDDWANRSVVAALVDSPEAVSWRWMGHIIGTHGLWLERLGQWRSPLAIWPELPPSDAATHLDRIRDGWRDYLRAHPALGDTARYTNSKGEPWLSKASDIAMHVILHGVYHRGQIASAMRRAGMEPVYTDFIHAVRRGFVE
jgi:L-amino acid N-acyltransferase YncA